MEELEQFDGRDRTAEIRQRIFEDRVRRLVPIKAKFIKARDKFEEKLKALFPQGAYVCWMHSSKSTQSGIVLLHGHYGRLRVRNSTTKTELWIESFQVIQWMNRNKV